MQKVNNVLIISSLHLESIDTLYWVTVLTDVSTKSISATLILSPIAMV